VELLATPTQSLSLGDLTILGIPITHILITTQAGVRNHCLLVAYNPLRPEQHDPSCQKSISTCQCNWEAAWWDGLAHHYLHPDFPPSIKDMLVKLENSPVRGVTTACRLQVIDVIREWRVFEMEDDIKEDALKKVRDHKGLRSL